MDTRTRIALGLTLLLAGCLGQTGEPVGGAQADGGGAGAGADAAPGGSAGLEILPKKIYSGFDGVAVYRAPILARGGTDLTWSLADPSLAQLMPEAGGTQLMIL